MPTYTWKDDAGKNYKITSETALSDADLASAVSGGVPAKTAEPKAKEPNLRNTGSLVGDIAALPRRAGRLMIGRDKPEGLDDYALMVGTSAPVIAATGGLASAAGAAPWLAAVARAAAAGGLGKLRGESNWTAAMEAAGAGVAEGALGLIGKLGGKAASGLARVKEIIGRGKDGEANVGTLVSKVENWLAASTKAERDALLQGLPSGAAPSNTAVEGIIPFLEKIDPRAARVFSEEVAKGTRLPRGHSLPALSPGASKGIADVAESAVLRSGADATVSSNRTASGMTAEAPAAGLMHLLSAPKRLLHLIP